MRTAWIVLACVTFQASSFGQKITVDQPIGSYVRAGASGLAIRLRIDPPLQRESIAETMSVRAPGIQTFPLLTCPIPFGGDRCEITLPLHRLGVYFLEIRHKERVGGKTLAETSITVAAIPDNRRGAIATTSPFAMGCYFAMRYSPEDLAAASKLAALAGVAYSREELRWDIAEPQRRTFTWEQFDRGVAACHENNIGVLGLIDYWGAYHDGNKPWSNEAVADFGQYVKNVIGRYKPGGTFWTSQTTATAQAGIREWEIWNEPATFWSYSGDQFGALTAAAYRAAKEADPACRIFYANAGDSFDAKALKTMGSSQAFDGITPHFYAPPRSPKEAGLLRNMKQQIAFFTSRDIRVPMWISEMGWHSGASPASQLAQADYLVQSCTLALAAGYDKVFWYNWANDSPDKNASMYGLLNRPDFSPKIGFAAFAGMARELDGACYQATLDLGRNVSCHIFRGAGTRETAVVWADEGNGRLLPRGHAASRMKWEVRDMFGNMIGPAAGRKTRIPLGSSPCYVHVDGNAAELLSGAGVEGIPQAELSLMPTVGALNAGSPVRFVIDNYTSKPMNAQLRLASDLMAFDAPKPSPVSAHSSSTFEARIRGLRRNPDNRYPVKVTVAGSAADKLDKNLTLYEKVAVRGTPRIDGDLADWKDARPLHLDSPDQAVGIVPWMDWNLSAVYYLMWDDDTLYFAARVRDNMFCQPNTGDLIWEGDSWQLGFDTEPGRHPSGQPEPAPSQMVIGLALAKNGPQAAAWNTKRDPLKIRVAIKQARAQSPDASPGGPPVTDELIYECAIPREMLAPMKMKPGTRFAFSVLLNDNDGGGRAGWMESTPGIGTGFEPWRYDIFELIGNEKD
ncbi:MAG: endo-1,4-beta-xylanase [Candidatus Sumerlaeota bacterium]|nr:endo-1,4-beta-xylanase [Candidatus Sumerlaeota bacterium]